MQNIVALYSIIFRMIFVASGNPRKFEFSAALITAQALKFRGL